jgi:Ca2+-binding RTX toxin-like protein
VQNVGDLAGTLGGASGDGQIDRVTVNATDGNDALTLAGDASGVTVSGLQAQVAIQHQDPTDQLFVEGLGGADTISATGLASGAISEFLDGGDGNDTIAGGPGAETLLGGNGNDSIDGNGGNDRASLGAGDDTFVWDPGDGSDTIEGGDGRDTMVFNGGSGPDTVDVSPNGNRLRFFRNPGNITMDTHEVERVVFNALGGADVVTVHDLAGTGVTSLDLDLAGTLGGSTGDGQTDRVVVDGTAGTDAFTVAGDASGVNVSGLAPTIELLHAEAADQLDFENLDFGDSVAAGALAAGTLQLFVDGILVP